MNQFDMEVWVRTVYGEARGEGEQGMKAVAHAINNRHNAGKWFSGKTLADACLFPLQFSCWNDNDPNRRIVASVNPDDGLFKLCRDACGVVMAGGIDPTHGATHYYSSSMPLPPEWAKAGRLTVTIGRHLFYAGVA